MTLVLMAIVSFSCVLEVKSHMVQDDGVVRDHSLPRSSGKKTLSKCHLML